MPHMLPHGPAGHWPGRSAPAGPRPAACLLLFGLCVALLAVALGLALVLHQVVAGVALLCAVVAVLGWQLARQHRFRQAAERDMRRSEGTFRTYFDHCADGIMVVRVEPDGGLVYEDVNRAAAAIMGIDAAAAIGRAPRDLWPPERARFIETQMRRCITGDAPPACGRTIELPPGPRKLRLTLAAVRDDGGRAHHIVTSVLDVTDRDMLEDQLRQAQKMEAIGRLTAGVAHDFNNLLQAVAGSLELLLDEVADLPTAREYAEITMRSAQRGAQLTHYLLAFARKQVLVPRVVALPELLSGFVAVLRRAIGPRFVLEVACAPDTPPAFADPGQIDVALLNLILNARDAMPEGGTLRIEARAAAAPCPQAPPGLAPGDYVVLAVVDHGTGMEPAVAARAVEPFFTTKGAKGSGLGLSMVHGFAHQSGGDVRIDSAPGRGTAVEIWLPRAAAAASPTAAPPAIRLRGAGRVLLVDDTPDVLLTIGAFVESAGYDVTRADGGEQALALLAAGERFDALVTDYAMPGLNGAALIRAALPLQPGLATLIITGFAEIDGLDTLPPTVRTLRKPFRREDLLRQLKFLTEPAG
ncbi:MAG: hypothetical protein BGP12_17830 [Rhodospirillales bacterium 70-18]|nr:PAS domain-containing protein [Rhodospirillales bacterium]OJY65710.1 MAG: hypothetical protein BGP12_17830 [Rhodospirillales bacterium 70-18]